MARTKPPAKVEEEDLEGETRVERLDNLTDLLSKDEQVELTAELQTLWLLHMRNLLRAGAASSTDMATLARVLIQNGWNLDPQTMPKDLKSKITSKVDRKKLDDDDLGPGYIAGNIKPAKRANGR